MSLYCVFVCVFVFVCICICICMCKPYVCVCVCLFVCMNIIVYSWLRTDTGGSVSICVFCDYSGTIAARILYYISYERFHFSLSSDLVIRIFRQKI